MPDKIDFMEQHNKEFKIGIFKVNYIYFTLIGNEITYIGNEITVFV